jgi:hypothetical protein
MAILPQLSTKARAALMVAALCVLAVIAPFIKPETYVEAQDLSTKERTFNALISYFKEVSHKKGALYAFEVLRRTKFPMRVDIHLVAHEIGEELYEEYGREAILKCTSEFRYACSHSVVIGTLVEYGPESLKDMAAICRQAPGGKGAYRLCFHGLGHGVLSYNGYEFDKGAEMCKTLEGKDGEATQCVGGMTMELLAGIHDKEVWTEVSPRYLNKAKPLFPCTADYLPEASKRICLIYLTPQLWKYMGANSRTLTDAKLAASMKFCGPLKETALRSACYGGFGKEFPSLTVNKDIREVELLYKTPEKLSRVHEMCELAGVEDGIRSCMIEANRSIYWAGENKPDSAIAFCDVAGTSARKKACFEAFFTSVAYYKSNKGYRSAMCAAVPNDVRSLCDKKLSISAPQR